MEGNRAWNNFSYICYLIWTSVFRLDLCAISKFDQSKFNTIYYIFVQML